MPRPPKDRHPVTQPSDPSYRLIPLTQGKNTIVDTADFEWLSQWNWCAQKIKKSFYVVRRNKGFIYMHRQILGCTEGETADHKNLNTLDNRRQNLRKCTRSQNQCNRPGWGKTCKFKGVYFDRSRGQWAADISLGNKRHRLGRFDSPEEAARAYDEAAKQYHGEFAQTNF